MQTEIKHLNGTVIKIIRGRGPKMINHPRRSKLRSHYAYSGDSIYVAIGRRYTADGWSDTQELFRFSGPSPDDLTPNGPRAIAESLRVHKGSPMVGDESIEGVTVYYHSIARGFATL